MPPTTQQTPPQSVPPSARANYELQAALAAAAVVAARRVESRGPEAVAQLVAAYQLYAAQQAAASVPATLAQQGLSDAALAALALTALAGIASDGRPLASLFAQAKNAAQLAMMVATQVQDAGRAAEKMAIAVSPGAEGYVRMLNPPSCSRCVILAGRVYKWNADFDRHPMCDCRQIPTSEALADDLTVNPELYFWSLDRKEQDRTFTKAGAEAIRLGADMGKVVNARRGMNTAQVHAGGSWTPKGRQIPIQLFGQRAYVTTEGVRRTRGGRKIKLDDGRIVRLMPETIISLARGDRAEAIRLLRLYGYVI